MTRVSPGVKGVATEAVAGPGGVGGVAVFLRRVSELSASSGDGAARAGDPSAPSEPLKSKIIRASRRQETGCR